MADIVLSVASKVAEFLVAPIGRQCGYVIFTNSYVGELKQEHDKLENARQRVQHSVDEAQNNGKPIEADVEEWMKQVETVAKKVRDVLDNDVRAKKTCFCGWLPNPKERYRLGRDARKTVQAIQELIPQGKFERVYYESTPPGPVAGAPDVNPSAGDGGNTITDSRASIFQGMMKALDDEKLKVIGVYGLGGVGKTTLLKEVEEKLRKEKRPFRVIVKAEVSRTPDLNNIQGQIADALSLNLKDKQSQQGRRDLLLERLKRDPNEKVLVILDDLWEELDLKAVGIPTGDESRGCKLLLSSRFKDVLEQKMHADRTFRLEGLKEDEAFGLFEKTVGDRLKDDEELKPIAAKVATKLAGLPLLINSVATFLKNSDVAAWRDASEKIDVKEMETIVQLSYDHLKGDDTKSLFLLCGLIGGTIKVETLLVLGIGMGLIERSTIQGSRDRLDTMLGELRSACLLLDGGDDKEYVTIHDLYSEVVVSTPFRGSNSLIIYDNCGKWPKEKLDECRACLVDVGNDRFVELMPRRFPQAKILMLSGKNDMGDCSKKYFKDMKELRALCLCSRSITSLPSPIDILGNLQSLIINCDVEDVAILGKLKALQILSFAGSMISKLPKEIEDLKNLKSLNLSSCRWLKIIEPGVLKGLINLEELLMRGSFDRWMGNDEVSSESCNAKLAELNSLTKLTSLEICISRHAFLSEDDDLPVGKLIRFYISIENPHGRKFKGLNTMKLNLHGCGNVLSRGWVQITLQKTEHLHLIRLSESKESAHELCTAGFRKLKHLDIDHSPSIKYIANSSCGLLLTAFTKLESLFLKNLINLEKISHGTIAPECFSKLKAVRIENCNRLTYLWCLSEIQRLVHLEDIHVWGCNSMRALIADDAGEDIVAADHMAELPNVRRLKLGWLPNMTSFCTETEITSEGTPIQVGLPNLEELKLSQVRSLKRIWLGEPPRSSFCELATLSLSDCYELVNIFPSTVIGRMHNLKQVEVFGCPLLESLFDFGSLDPNTEQTRVLLPKLEQVCVYKCPSLESLFDCGSLDPNTEQTIVLLPKLEELTVIEAKKLRHVVKSDTQTIFNFPHLPNVNCEQLKEVVPKEEGSRSKGVVMSFPSLSDITILRCSNFRAFNSNPTSVDKKLDKMAEENDESSQPLFNEMVKLPNVRSLQIEGAQCKELWNNQIPDDSFCKLEFLLLKHCDNLQCIAPSHMWKRLQRCLNILQVESCCSIEIIYEGDKIATKSGTLRRLVLRDLKNLRHIWQSDGLPKVPFPSLRFIEVWSCPRLRILFSTFTPEFLKQIKELAVESCKDMELIVGYEGCEEATDMAITFFELTVLRLFKLPKFESFLPKKYSVEFPSLQVLSKVSCGREPDQGLGEWARYKPPSRELSVVGRYGFSLLP